MFQVVETTSPWLLVHGFGERVKFARPSKNLDGLEIGQTKGLAPYDN